MYITVEIDLNEKLNLHYHILVKNFKTTHGMDVTRKFVWQYKTLFVSQDIRSSGLPEQSFIILSHENKKALRPFSDKNIYIENEGKVPYIHFLSKILFMIKWT